MIGASVYIFVFSWSVSPASVGWWMWLKTKPRSPAIYFSLHWINPVYPTENNHLNDCNFINVTSMWSTIC